MGTEIMLPNELSDIASMKYVAIFLNGFLLCPSQPDDLGDYCFDGTDFNKQLFGAKSTAKRISFYARIEPSDLVQVTDFKSFRWTFTYGCWKKL